MADLLDVTDLTIRIADHTPVRDLSFSVRGGETLAIVGESGSGKSMTAMAIMGLLPDGGRVTRGGIHFAGRNLAGMREKDLRGIRGKQIGMIFQEPMTSLNPVLTIGEQITEILRLHERMSGAQAVRRAAELLDRVRVPDPARQLGRYPHHLSGGMRQRVMIAMAIACRPPLLIADEPTTALDVTIQAQILDLLDGLRRDFGMGLILITHDLGVVAQWADRVVVMYAGRKVEEAGPAALFDDPVHPYSKGLVAASPRMNQDHYRTAPLVEIPGSMASAAGQPGCSFAPRCAWSVEACRTMVPPLVAVGGSRLAACPVTA